MNTQRLHDCCIVHWPTVSLRLKGPSLLKFQNALTLVPLQRRSMVKCPEGHLDLAHVVLWIQQGSQMPMPMPTKAQGAARQLDPQANCCVRRKAHFPADPLPEEEEAMLRPFLPLKKRPLAVGVVHRRVPAYAQCSTDYPRERRAYHPYPHREAM